MVKKIQLNGTRYDNIVLWAKERWVSSVILIFFILIVGLGTLTESIDKILAFKHKYMGSEAVTNISDAPLSASQSIKPHYEKYRLLTTNRLNPDYQIRDAIIKINTDWAKKASNVVDFYGLKVEDLKELIDENFIDPQDKQNNAPTVHEFYEYLQLHPEFTVSGYAVGPSRSDYRISITALESPQDGLTPYMVESFLGFCSGADDISSQMVCWWD